MLIPDPRPALSLSQNKIYLKSVNLIGCKKINRTLKKETLTISAPGTGLFYLLTTSKQHELIFCLLTFTFIHLGDAFVQCDVQTRYSPGHIYLVQHLV